MYSATIDLVAEYQKWLRNVAYVKTDVHTYIHTYIHTDTVKAICPHGDYRPGGIKM